MWSTVLMLSIAFFVLALALAFKVVAKVSDSRPVFKLAVVGFLLIYILAAIVISRLNPGLKSANVSSLSSVWSVSSPASREENTFPSVPEDHIIRE